MLGADEERPRIAPHRMAGGVDVPPPQSLRRSQVQVVAIVRAPARLGQRIGVTGGRVDVAHASIVSAVAREIDEVLERAGRAGSGGRVIAYNRPAITGEMTGVLRRALRADGRPGRTKGRDGSTRDDRNRRAALLEHRHALGRDRPREGRRPPAPGPERCRQGDARSLHHLVHRGGMHGGGRPRREHLRPPSGHGRPPAARPDGQPPRHPGRGRQVRRHRRRARRPRGTAHPRRPARPDQAPARAGLLDE